ncbi:MAG: M24 family metallopeptidase [Planctomycetes bacterium]|nr:M24 family metallopeptidase [Planctomycetota bacterium]
MNEKERRLARFCKAGGYDGVIFRRRSGIAWIADGADVHVDMANAFGVATVLWTPAKKTVFTDAIEAARLKDEEFRDGWSWEVVPWWETPKLPEGRWATDEDVAELRFSLTRDELKRLRLLGRESAEAMATVLKNTGIGWTEHEVAGALTWRLRERGIFPHVLMVAADERADRYRHPIPTSTAIRRKAVASLCAQRQGLIVCLTRVVHFGSVPKDLRRRHDAVCAVDAALHAATRPGHCWGDLLREAIAVYRRTGFPNEWKKHHQGGPMGYECRDFKVTLEEKRVVKENQAVGWNPTISGTKSEDTILSSGEVLTPTDDWPMNGGRPDILRRK